MSDRPAGSSALPPAGAGIALLVLGAILLLGEGSLSISNPTFVGVWTVGTGLLVLLGAILVTILRTPAAELPTPRAERTKAKVPAPVAPPRTPTPARVPARSEPSPPWTFEARGDLGAPRPGTAAFGTAAGFSSIPAQYSRLTPPPMPSDGFGGEPEWSEEPTVPLPFSAGAGLLGPVAPFDPYAAMGAHGSVETLEAEVVRLRERIRELEEPTGSRPEAIGPMPLAPSVVPYIGPPMAEPPRPSFEPRLRACTGCGSELPGGTTDPLCWGCGRALCTTCYWRTKEGPGAHTCPTCFARTGAPSGLRPSGPASASTAGGPAPPRATVPAPR